MYHIELRQFPHNTCRFNLSERELFETIVRGWAQEQWIEIGERKWNPNLAKLTVLEGPQLSMGQLAMSRGWRNAERHSEDVTERVLARARAASQPGADALAPAPGAATSAAPGLATAVGEPDQLQPLLGEDPAALLKAWRLSAERRPELAPSEALALAEATLSSLDASER